MSATSRAATGMGAPPVEASAAAKLPAGRRVHLEGRGKGYVREVEGPAGAPAVVLLHGWMASAGLNWHGVFDPLGSHFRVIAPDLRGHGRGIRSWRRFRLADCADDTAALLDALEVESAIVVGYSMGGPVAKLLWQRHPSRIAGLVLCATSHRPARMKGAGRTAFASTMTAVAGTARLAQLGTGIPTRLRRELVERIGQDPDAPSPMWATAEMHRHDLRMLMEAMSELGRFDSEDWLRQIDVPTACVVTTGDRAIPPGDQMQLARGIRNASVHCVSAGHAGSSDPRFAKGLVNACREVAARAAAAPSPARRARQRRWLEARVDALLS